MTVGLKVRTLRDIPTDINDEPVLIRADLNVPQDENRSVTDTAKLKAIKDTILLFRKLGAKPVICSHLGRPDGKFNEKYSLLPVVSDLEIILGTNVCFIPDCIGEERDRRIRCLSSGQVALLENLRFYEGEEKNEPKFAAQLAKGFDCYVNEAFPASHRAHASIVGVPEIIGKKASFAGYNFQIEFENLSKFTRDQIGQVALVFGGAKAKDKIKVIKSMLEKNKADIFVTAGAIGNTFLRGLGYGIGDSLFAADCVSEAEDIYRIARRNGKDFIVPTDATILRDNGDILELLISDLKPGDVIFDIGEETFHNIKYRLQDARTIFWNGAFGKAEDTRFSRGTHEFGEFLAELSDSAFVIIGGGDTSALISGDAKTRIIENGGYISTSGGAAMEFLAKGGTLPGIQALEFA